jgi:regulator of protease activity HflC (stomatin/prohibitin superfamily)
MFERLLELVLGVWDSAVPWVVVNAYENSVVLRLGKYHRTLTPGLHWKLPFADDPNGVNMSTTTLRLPPQTLTTQDGIGVVVSVIVKYKVVDPRPYVTDVWDQVDVLADTVMGATRLAVADATWKELAENPPEKVVAASTRKQVNKYGFRVEAITFIDLGRVRSIRLMGDREMTSLDN